MAAGKLYVVFNKWIRCPQTNKMPYKIGITKNTVKERYYGLEIKMPGQFESLLIYELDDYARAEDTIHNILQKYNIKGEWFNINDEILEHIKKSCEIMGGRLVTEESIKQEEGPLEEDEPIVGESIIMKGVSIPLYKNKYETTQDFVKRLLKLLYKHNLIPEHELKNMLKKDYSLDTFGIQFPLIQDDPKKLIDDKGHSRYWADRVIGKYYVCSQWWKQKENDYKEKLAKWVIRMKKYNARANVT